MIWHDKTRPYYTVYDTKYLKQYVKIKYRVPNNIFSLRKMPGGSHKFCFHKFLISINRSCVDPYIHDIVFKWIESYFNLHTQNVQRYMLLKLRGAMAGIYCSNIHVLLPPWPLSASLGYSNNAHVPDKSSRRNHAIFKAPLFINQRVGSLTAGVVWVI